jgi:glycosyltransferase involved in cell wall biosynthesis
VDLRIAHISFSQSGGAGIVAERLCEAQRSAGLDSSFVYQTNSGLKSNPFSSPRHTILAAIDSSAVKRPGFPAMVSFARDRAVSSSLIPKGKNVYHLHWISGVTTPDRLPVANHAATVWTLHDMNPFTGACHHSLTCDHFQEHCGDCPAVRSMFQPGVTRNLQRKGLSVSRTPGLTLVSPSQWLADAAEKSSIFSGHTVHVIPNPVDERFFNNPSCQEALHIGSNPGLVSVVVAQDLDDKTKNVDQAVRAFQQHHIHNPDSTLVLIGLGGKRFRGIPGVLTPGKLGVSELVAWFDRADALIVSSEAENAPLVVYEAAARGCWPILASHTGLIEIPDRLGAGSTFTSEESLSSLLDIRHGTEPALRLKQRAALRESSRKICHPEKVEKAYRNLYFSALSSGDPQAEPR